MLAGASGASKSQTYLLATFFECPERCSPHKICHTEMSFGRGPFPEHSHQHAGAAPCQNFTHGQPSNFTCPEGQLEMDVQEYKPEPALSYAVAPSDVMSSAVHQASEWTSTTSAAFRQTAQQPVSSRIDHALAVSARYSFQCPFPPECEPEPISSNGHALHSLDLLPPSSLRPDEQLSFENDDEDIWSSGSFDSSLTPDATGDHAGFRDQDSLDSSGGDDGDDDESDGSYSDKKPSGKRKVARRGRRCKSKKWSERLSDLKSFKRKYGHCKVSSQEGNDPELVQWVKRQRYHFKLKCEGKESPIVDAQVKQLDEIGFVWNSHGSAWETKLAMLEEFKEQHGHCRVPRDYDENPPLSTWVKRQRRLYKADQVSPSRVARLEAMGFVWDPRGIHDKIGKNKAKPSDR